MDWFVYICYTLDLKSISRYRWTILRYNQSFLTSLLTAAHQTGTHFLLTSETSVFLCNFQTPP